MKSLIKAPIAYLLGALAKAVVRKYRPKIIMVTGSVGKTSTKDAIAAALSTSYRVRKSDKSYNSEFGVPFTVLGVNNPWTNPFAWLGIFLKAFSLLLFPHFYPNLLVLEVGADRPGDLAKILRFVSPYAVVVTRLPDIPVHVEAYPSPAAVREEEFAPALALTDGAPLILSTDDLYAGALADRLPVTLTTFGSRPGADVLMEEPAVYEEEGVPVGMQAKLLIDRTRYPLIVRGAFGSQQLFAPTAAIATARALSISLEDALAALTESYEPPPGRSRLLRGINGSTLIDDTYNSSPLAVEEALKSLALIQAKRRIAVLGDMRELGRYSKEEHERIGALAFTHAEIIVAIGPRSRAITDAAAQQSIPAERFRWFETSSEAADTLRSLVTEGDLVLIKGSQSVRTERVTEALLQDSSDAIKLVRQEREWKGRE